MNISLRPITPKNQRAVWRCKVSDEQAAWVAPNMMSLAEAYANPRLVPLAIYDAGFSHREAEDSDPVRGFVMYQVWDEIGFIKRLMVAPDCQGQGYGRAAMIEVLRRMKLIPEVRRIATSWIPENVAAARLYTSLGFTRPLATESTTEVYFALDWDRDPYPYLAGD